MEMEMERDKIYYMPRRLPDPKHSGKTKLGTGIIMKYNPRVNDEGRKILGDMIVDLRKEVYPVHDFSFPTIPLKEDYFKSIPGFDMELSVPLPKVLIIDRKLKKPTQIPNARVRLLQGYDEATGVLWSNVIPELRRLEKKTKFSPEEEAQLDKYRRAHENLLWIVMIERVAEQIAISLRKMSLIRGEKGTALKRAENEILRTLPTQRVIDRALVKNLYRPSEGEFLRGFESLQTPSIPGAPDVTPESPSVEDEPEEVRLASAVAKADAVSAAISSPTPLPTVRPPPLPVPIPVVPDKLPEVQQDTPEDLTELSTEETDVQRLVDEIPEVKDEYVGGEEESKEAEDDGEIMAEAQKLIDESLEVRDEYVGGEEESKEPEDDEGIMADAQRLIDESPEVRYGYDGDIVGGEEESKEPKEEAEAVDAVEDDVLFEDDRGHDFDMEPEEADDRVTRFNPDAIERSRRIREHIAKLDSSSITDIYTKYTKALELYENDILNKRLESVLNTLSFTLEQKDEDKDTEIVGFPTYYNTNFQKEITLREDFAPYKLRDSGISIIDRIREIEDSPITTRFNLQNHQRYISRFLSSDTPYNSLLVYHEVGTGKTCMAIQVAEMYLAETGGDRKAIVIAPIAVQPGFKREIFDSGKLDSDDPTNQCTGDIYTTKVGATNTRSVIRAFQDLVNSRYDLYGYGTFEKMFENEIIEPSLRAYPSDTSKASHMMIDRIAEIFGDGMIIVDEVHNIRDPEEKKKIMRYLMLIARFANNTRILLMSATPMYNRSSEILPILNILRINEGLAPIPHNMVFDNGMITREGEDILRETCIGFVSYLRGENPVDFPVRLSPPDFVMRGRNSRPVLDMTGNEIDNDLPVGTDILPIVRVPLKEGTLIAKKYQEEMEGKSEGGRKLIAPSAATGLKQTAVCVFPSGNSGAEGFADTFVRSTSKRSYLRLRNRSQREDGAINPDGKLFLHPDRIANYSPKIAEIIDLAKDANGIVLIFTENIQGSAIPMGIALEQLGFQRYGGESLLSLPDDVVKENAIDFNGLTKEEHVANGGKSGDWHPATYTIISADPYVTKRREKIIRRASASDNTRGEVIKVIIATEAISEGVNFKNIREVHITDAHYHISLMDQVVGRAQRFRSHKNLPIEERNVNVYAWSVSWDSSHPKHGTETADEELYRFAEEKSVEVGKISRILKENAIDCHLTEEVNNRVSEAYNVRTMMIDSQGIEREHKYADVPGSRECDFQESCAIACATSIEDPKAIKSTIASEGLAQEAEVRREIRLYMLLVTHTDLTNLVYQIRSKIPGIRKRTIERVVYDMVTDETRILDPNGGVFTIQARQVGSTTYLTLGPTEIVDSRSTFLDRITRLPRKSEYIMAPDEKILEGEGGEDVASVDDMKVYNTFRESFLQKWGESGSGSIIARAMRLVEGIPDEIWAVVLAESFPDMADPVKRREILRGIANEPTSTSEVLNMIRGEFVKTGEIHLPGRRDSRTRIWSINSSGMVDVVVASTNEKIDTKPIIHKMITYGFYTYRAQGTQKKKRGDPEGMLRLYFQNYRRGMTRVARGFYADTSTGGMEQTRITLYKPGTGFVIGECIIPEDVLVKEFPSSDPEKSTKLFFRPKNADLVKYIAEACTRKNNTYRSPVESQYRIES